MYRAMMGRRFLREAMTECRYPTDLTDAQCAHLAPLLPAQPAGPGLPVPYRCADRHERRLGDERERERDSSSQAGRFCDQEAVDVGRDSVGIIEPGHVAGTVHET